MPLLEVKNLTKRFPIKGGFFGKPKAHVHALTDVSLSVEAGEIVGLVGESGCGKSTLGRTILKLLQPDAGQIYFEGENITPLSQKEMRPKRKRMQMIFQDPYSSLNPRMRVGDTLAEPFYVHGLASKKDANAKVLELLNKVGLKPEAALRYPHEFSGGQRQRIGIARALALNPKLVIADEPVSALDVSIQAQIINLLSDLQKELKLSLVFIAHDLKVVEHLSNRIVVMYLGKIMEEIPGHQLSQARHPYTKALLSSVPIADPAAKRERIILSGDVPSPISPPSGCVFRTRCPIAKPECAQNIPPLREVSAGHKIACDWV